MGAGRGPSDSGISEYPILFPHVYVHLNHRIRGSGYAQAVICRIIKRNMKNCRFYGSRTAAYVFPFYTKYDPVKYLASGGTSSGGFAEVKTALTCTSSGRYQTGRRNCMTEDSIHWISGENFPGDAYTITYLNGDDAMRISE